MGASSTSTEGSLYLFYHRGETPEMGRDSPTRPELSIHSKNVYHTFLLGRFRLLLGHGEIGDPLATFLFEAQETRNPYQFDISTGDVDLLDFALQTHGTVSVPASICQFWLFH
jgi:hypothetical protein